MPDPERVAPTPARLNTSRLTGMVRSRQWFFPDHRQWFFPDHMQKIFRTLPITGKKYFVLYLRWLGEGNFLVQILCGGSVIGHDCEADGNAGRPQPGFFRITGKKYFVPYRSQAKNISYPTDQGITHYLSVIPLTLERSKDRLSLVYPP